MKHHVVLITALILSACARQDRATERDLDAVVVRGDLAATLDRFLTQEADSGFSGCVLVAKEGRIILHKGYGWADREKQRAVTTTTPFWVASISKQFAAAAILSLLEEGRVSLEDTIPRFFSNVPVDKRGITVHQLLTHTAGLAQRYAADGITDRDRAVEAILAAPLERAPGQQFAYTNDAYNLVAAIVEIAAGEPYETFLRRRLFEPAGLSHTGFWGPPEHPDVAAILGSFSDYNLAPNWGYRGAVGVFSTSGDLYRWELALEGEHILSPASRRQLRTAHTKSSKGLGIGYGWFVGQTPRSTTSIWTRGYEQFGHGAVLATYPQEAAMIVITSNAGEKDGRPFSHKLSQDLEALVLGSP